MNLRAGVAIADRWRPGDVLGLIAGRCQQAISDLLRATGLNPVVWEWGIGYSGVLADTHHTFESYAWAHHVAGLSQRDDVRFFDSVVPNCFDIGDFTVSIVPGDYLLYMGRPTPRKGLPIITEIAQRTDIPIKIAGQPGADIPGTEYVGLVTGQVKADLLAGARALLAPTTYLEPFGGVAVEAMLSGTPVITTDWGAFTETVRQGITGFRCHTLREFLTAVDQAGDLNRARIFEYARARYSLETGSQMYAQVIQRLLTLYGDGWYHGTVPARTTA
jgi:glycosyltransferase involved in cell wall biosynthesis